MGAILPREAASFRGGRRREGGDVAAPRRARTGRIPPLGAPGAAILQCAFTARAFPATTQHPTMTRSTGQLSPALYHRDGDTYVPTPLAGGPWSADAQHGGPPGGLLAREAEGRAREAQGEGAPAPAPLQPVRHTVDLFRPVPLRPLEVVSRLLRSGRRIAVVESMLRCADADLAKATTVFLRPAAGGGAEAAGAGPHLAGAPERIPGPEGFESAPLVPGPWAERLPPGFHFEVEVRWVDSDPPTAWFRPPMALVAGERPTPFQRVAVVADLGNAVSAARRQARGVPQFSLINVDITLHLVGLPAGEWVALRSSTVAGDRGLGFAHLDVYGLDGWVGSVTQASLAQRDGAAPGASPPPAGAAEARRIVGGS
jgi:hypothetical protein